MLDSKTHQLTQNRHEIVLERAGPQPDTWPTHPCRLVADHPGWLWSDNQARRAFRVDGKTWSIVLNQADRTFDPTIETDEDIATRTLFDWFGAITLAEHPHAAPVILDVGAAYRVRTPDVWEALLSVVLRHRARRREAGAYYRALCQLYGTVVPTSAGPALLPPHPKTLIALPNGAFSESGAKGLRLRTIAAEYLNRSPDWTEITPADLVKELQSICGVGKWTARQTVADMTNDFEYRKIE